jgi:hypothetical protein
MVQVIICKYQGQELFGQPVGTLEKQFRILEKICIFPVFLGCLIHRKMIFIDYLFKELSPKSPKEA